MIISLEHIIIYERTLQYYVNFTGERHQELVNFNVSAKREMRLIAVFL